MPRRGGTQAFQGHGLQGSDAAGGAAGHASLQPHLARLALTDAGRQLVRPRQRDPRRGRSGRERGAGAIGQSARIGAAGGRRCRSGCSMWHPSCRRSQGLSRCERRSASERRHDRSDRRRVRCRAAHRGTSRLLRSSRAGFARCRRIWWAGPSYLARRGTPKHPLELAEHSCLGYAYLQTPGVCGGSPIDRARPRPYGPPDRCASTMAMR